VKNGTDRAESLLWRTTLARTVEAGNVAETRKRELERSRNSDRLRKVEARAVVAAAPSPRLNAHELLTQGAAETRAAIDASYAPRLATCEALIAAAAAARGDLALLGKETSPARGRPAEGVLNILSADLMAGDFTRAEVAAFFRAGVTPESVRDVTPESVREVTPESVRERASAKRRARKAPVNNEPSPNAARIRQRFGLTREQAAEKIREYEEQDEKRGTPAALTTRVKKRAPNAR
jgi:hypothetical protein